MPILSRISALAQQRPDTLGATRRSWALIPAVFLACLLSSCIGTLLQSREEANQAVHHFHQELNDAQYDQICQEADSRFSQSDTHENLVKFLRGVHTKLGNTTAENLGNTNVNATTNGTFIVASYDSIFSLGKAQETFTWVRGSSGLKLVRYNVQSNAFIIN
jgi:hypothetical protein